MSLASNEENDQNNIEHRCHSSPGWTSNVFADFATLVSSCNDIISAGVPQSLEKAAHLLLEEYGTKWVDLEIVFSNHFR